MIEQSQEKVIPKIYLPVHANASNQSFEYSNVFKGLFFLDADPPFSSVRGYFSLRTF